uniref:ABC transmembrane type-1 domain-containing protein n=1 Tax=Panagrolaimus superbus TaxID=310955 RepID=A0A914YSW4_9BILA
MELKDDRLKLMTDVLSGVKVLKLYAWEESMHARISKIRTQEATQRKYGIYCYSLVDITFDSCPIFATIVSFIGYIIIQGHPLTPQVAFISLMLFNLMRFSIYSIPKLFQEVINARISLNRVQDFLLESEVPDLVNTINTSDQSIVFQVKDADFSWTLDPQILPTLKSLSLEIKEGELIGIIGRVGSGKSSLLSSICGELNQISGEFFRKPSLSIAYAPQETWIQNLSFRNNILFGKTFDEQLYQKNY